MYIRIWSLQVNICWELIQISPSQRTSHAYSIWYANKNTSIHLFIVNNFEAIKYVCNECSNNISIWEFLVRIEFRMLINIWFHCDIKVNLQANSKKLNKYIYIYNNNNNKNAHESEYGQLINKLINLSRLSSSWSERNSG